MMIDVWFSALHFLLVFLLVSILAAEGAMIRPGMTTSSVRLAGKLDRAYGASAVLLLGVGFGRVFLGDKGSAFYLSNPLFWVKLLLFMIVAVLSVPPTIQLIRWTNHARLRTDFVPPGVEIGRMQRWLLAESMVFVFIPLVAAAMARGFGRW